MFNVKTKMKKRKFAVMASLLWGASLYAQNQAGDSLATSQPESQIQAGFFDSNSLGGIDYSEFKLPPLGVLFENAKSTPSIELLEKERRLAEKMLSKEKRAFLDFSGCMPIIHTVIPAPRVLQRMSLLRFIHFQVVQRPIIGTWVPV